MTLRTLLVLASLFPASQLHAGSCCGGCAPVAPPLLTPAPVSVVASYEWRPDGEGGYGLFRAGRQVGYLSPTGAYSPRLGPGRFSAPCKPPVGLPAGSVVAKRGGDEPCQCNASGCKCGDDCQCGRNGGLCCDTCTCAVSVGKSMPLYFGVDPSRITPGRNLLNGRECSKREALQAIQEGVPDDSKHLRLTVIGTPEERGRVLQDLKASPVLAEWRDKLLVKDYAPGDWAVRDAGFKLDGKPIIYYQEASGKVLHRQDDYEGGAEALALALRRADPNYDNKRDPDKRRQPALPVDESLSGVLPYLLVGGAGVMAYYLSGGGASKR